MEIQHTMNCGIAEFQGLNDDNYTLRDCIALIAEEMDFGIHNDQPPYGQCGAMIFTFAWDGPERPKCYGPRRLRAPVIRRYNALAKFLVDNDLGDFYDLPKIINPNHNSTVEMGIWQINIPNFHAYCLEEDIGTGNEEWRHF